MKNVRSVSVLAAGVCLGGVVGYFAHPEVSVPTSPTHALFDAARSKDSPLNSKLVSSRVISSAELPENLQALIIADGAKAMARIEASLGKRKYASQMPVLLEILAASHPDELLDFVASNNRASSVAKSTIIRLFEETARRAPEKIGPMLQKLHDPSLRRLVIDAAARAAVVSGGGAAFERLISTLPEDVQITARKTYLSEIAIVSPEAALSFYNSLDEHDADQARGVMGDALITENPMTGANWWYQNTPAEEKAFAAGEIVGHMAAQGCLEEASRWLNSLPAGQAKDYGIAEIVKATIADDSEAALTWLKTMSDSGLRTDSWVSAIRSESARDATAAAKLRSEAPSEVREELERLEN